MKYTIIFLSLIYTIIYAKPIGEKSINEEAIFTYFYGCDKYCVYDIKLTKKANRNKIYKVYILSSNKQPLLNKKYHINIQEGKAKLRPPLKIGALKSF